MTTFQTTGVFKVSPDILETMRQTFIGGRLDDDGITQVIRDTYTRTGQLIDPHTAIACAPHLLQALPEDTAHVSLACAHPAKFPNAVNGAVGVLPELPDFLDDLFERKEQFTVLENDTSVVKAFVEETLGAG